MSTTQSLQQSPRTPRHPNPVSPGNKVSFFKDRVMGHMDTALCKNLVPDFLIRMGIRNLLRQRLREEAHGNLETRRDRFAQLLHRLESSPIAVNTLEANEQHYEVPALFYQHVLGRHLKYSCGYWPEGVTTLDDAEKAMLDLTIQRAQLKPGQRVLELGCGWGSLTLAMAERFPQSRITAVSNSHGQRNFIQTRAKERGLNNLEIITCDMNYFDTDHRYDRIVSVEMFEHMRNYRQLFDRVYNLLEDSGKLFVHIFVHKEYAYLFEALDDTDWMSKYFFTGGIMPSDHLLFYFANRFRVESHWNTSGVHYQKTAEAWLQNMDQHQQEVRHIFRLTYGEDQEDKWWAYWRTFFMACAELWGFKQGEEWYVSHYLFAKPSGESLT